MNPAGGTLQPSENREAEESVLGAMMVSAAALAPVLASGICPDDFYREQHRKIFTAIQDLDAASDPVDALSVSEMLTQRGELEAVGGRDLVHSLAATAPAPGNASHYAEIVLSHARQRDKVGIGQDLTNGMTPQEGIERLKALELSSASTLPTTWAPVDLEPALRGERSEQPPEMLSRSDGPCLLYAGKSHALSAEPEAGKSWLALLAARGEMGLERDVIYIDFEDGPETVVGRLGALKVDSDQIREHFHYIRPDEPMSDAAWADIEALLPAVSLVVIDGVTEALTRHGLDLRDNTDIAKWLELLPRRLQRHGCAVLSLDHVTKDKETRGRYAIGAQHKLAGVDVAYSMKVAKPFGRGVDGLVKVHVEKDRPGYIRTLAKDGQIALLRFNSHDDGRVDLALDPPDANTPGAFRPTHLMEMVSLAIETNPGVGKKALRAAVSGKSDFKDLALAALIADGFVRVEVVGQAHEHHSVKPYREEDEDGES